MANEMRDHIEQEAARAVAEGVDPGEARRLASLAFGSMDARSEEVRERRFGFWLEELVRDARLATRRLCYAPGFTLFIVLTLAVGIGVNLAIYSLLNAVLARPLAFPNSDRIAVIGESPANRSYSTTYGGSYADWHAKNLHFEFFGAAHESTRALSGRGLPQSVPVVEVVGDLFNVFGITPRIGRTFQPSDYDAGREAVALVTYEFWQGELAGTPDVLTETLVLDGTVTRIVGVLGPEAFPSPRPRVFLPSTLLDNRLLLGRDSDYLVVSYGLLKGTSSASMAEAQLNDVKNSVRDEYVSGRKEWRVNVDYFRDAMIGENRRNMFTVAFAAGTVLLMACVNITSLIVARNSWRQSEVSLRIALGATSARIVQYILTESMLLAIFGGTLSVGVAFLAFHYLSTLVQGELLRLIDPQVDWRVTVVAIAAILGCGLSSGIIPVFQAIRPQVAPGLKAAYDRGTTRKRQTLQSTLVVAEVAIAVALLITAGLLLWSLKSRIASNPGFDHSELLVFETPMRPNIVGGTEDAARYSRAILGEVGKISGIESVTASSAPPLGGHAFRTEPIKREGAASSDGAWEAVVSWISPNYRDVLRIPLVSGRDLSLSDDREEAEKVVIVNRKLVMEMYGADESPLGSHLVLNGVRWKIVGVVGDVSRTTLGQEALAEIYIPRVGMTVPAYYIARSSMSPQVLTDEIRRAVDVAHPGQPVGRIDALTVRASRTLFLQRVFLTLISAFAGIALVLAGIGIFGVTSYSVRQRMHEMGIRLAFGASPRVIFAMVLVDSLRLVAAGGAIGLIAGYIAADSIERFLFSVGPFNAQVYGWVIAITIAVGTMACVLPAARAARIEPADTLRAD